MPVVRVDFDGPPPSGRRIDDRLAVRFPQATQAFTRLGFRLLNPRSRVRQVFLRRAILSGWGCARRQDWELMLTRYSPAVVYVAPTEFEPLGFTSPYHGHAGVREALGQFAEAFEFWEALPASTFDLGDRLVTLGTFHGRARESGLDWQEPFAQLVTLERGAVIREQSWYDWAKALEAGGLDPALAAFLRPRP